MTEYVTKEKALAQLEKNARDPYHESHYIRDAVINTINRMEAADVVEVVRCKDCFLFGECKAAEWYGENGNGYCSVGDRRKDND